MKNKNLTDEILTSYSIFLREVLRSILNFCIWLPNDKKFIYHLPENTIPSIVVDTDGIYMIDKIDNYEQFIKDNPDYLNNLYESIKSSLETRKFRKVYKLIYKPEINRIQIDLNKDYGCGIFTKNDLINLIENTTNYNYVKLETILNLYISYLDENNNKYEFYDSSYNKFFIETLKTNGFWNNYIETAWNNYVSFINEDLSFISPEKNVSFERMNFSWTDCCYNKTNNVIISENFMPNGDYYKTHDKAIFTINSMQFIKDRGLCLNYSFGVFNCKNIVINEFNYNLYYYKLIEILNSIKIHKMRLNLIEPETINDVLDLINSWPQCEKPYPYDKTFYLGRFKINLNNLIIEDPKYNKLFFLGEDDDNFWLEDNNSGIYTYYLNPLIKEIRKIIN